jgi:hypothetical protein
MFVVNIDWSRFGIYFFSLFLVLDLLPFVLLLLYLLCEFWSVARACSARAIKFECRAVDASEFSFVNFMVYG